LIYVLAVVVLPPNKSSIKFTLPPIFDPTFPLPLVLLLEGLWVETGPLTFYYGDSPKSISSKFISLGVDYTGGLLLAVVTDWVEEIGVLF